MDSKEHWDKFNSSVDISTSNYDGWLDKYELNLLGEDKTILELGCGWGDDTQYLCTLDAKVICLDFSSKALKVINARFPDVKTVFADLRERLPLTDSSIDCIVADLCLHYFSRQKTIEIMRELIRVMSGGALLLCRVNSKSDSNYKYQDGEEIERDFYMTEQGEKRLFGLESIEEAFSVFDILDVREYEMNRYSKPKMVWEIACRKAD